MMASIAVRHYSEDYDDMVVAPTCDVDESGLAVAAIPVLWPSVPHVNVRFGADSLLETHSIRLVFDNIKRAPIAYFRFMSTIGFVLFTFSLLFYLVFGTIVFNPLLAVFGAFGALLTLLLVEASLLVEKRNSKKGQREFSA
jgi:hypothetical protein